MKYGLAILAAVLVPLVMLITSFGHYGARSVAFVRLNSLGSDMSMVGTTMAAGTIISVVAMLLSAPLSAATGPAPAASLGLAIAALGQLVTGGSNDLSTVLIGSSIAAFGWGLHRPALLGALGRWLGRGLDGGRTAAIAAAYGAVNVGAAFSFLAPMVSERFGMHIPPLVAGMTHMVGAVLMMGMFAASFGLPVPTGPGTSETLDLRTILIAVGAAALGTVAVAAWSIGADFAVEAAYTSSTPPSATWQMINPAVVAGTAGFVAVAALVAQAIGVRPPMLLMTGLGVWVWAAGLGAQAMLPGDLRVGDVIGGVGEVLFYGGLLSAITGAVHFRLIVVPVAIVTATPYLASLATRPFQSMLSGVATPIIAACAVLCVPVGAAFVVMSVLLERPAVADPPEPTE